MLKTTTKRCACEDFIGEREDENGKYLVVDLYLGLGRHLGLQGSVIRLCFLRALKSVPLSLSLLVLFQIAQIPIDYFRQYFIENINYHREHNFLPIAFVP